MKACTSVLKAAFSNEAIAEIADTLGRNDKPYVRLLARTSKVYGLKLDNFRSRLIHALATLHGIDQEFLERQISVTTAHGSKGQEAHTVIILDATERQFPKVHPDNLLFELFGVTPLGVLDEERRLFYVAITRAERTLYVLTEQGKESPYLEAIQEFLPPVEPNEDRRSFQPQVAGELAREIKTRLEARQTSAVNI